ncbi:MAG: SUMF1/EgtB/PvdO family nonheme iron enzyme [Myxococcales bacterium]|nr:SUMF1/EgtB/PvdO family nonheme iron enzyme [Myxococcales bacterium]
MAKFVAVAARPSRHVSRGLACAALLALTAGSLGCVEEAVPAHTGFIGGGDVGSGVDTQTPVDTGYDAGKIPCTSDDECIKAMESIPACRIAVCAQGSCKLDLAPNKSACDADSDACTSGDSCSNGTCVAGKKQLCDDGNPCTKGVCDPTDGTCEQTNRTDGSTCDDGSDCTTADACAAGKCVSAVDICPCSPAEISACWAKLDLDEKNLCTGKPYCEAYAAGAQKLYRCALNPSTVVTCSKANDTECLQSVCDPGEGKCKLKAINENKQCSDGNSCTKNDACTEGQCVGPVNLCSCGPKIGVDKCYGKLNLDKDNPCLGQPYCATTYDEKTKESKYVCALNNSTVVHCGTSNNTACRENKCEPKTGKCLMTDVNEGKTVCDDGSPCTVNDKCEKGQCKAELSVCACAKTADCQKEEDGNLCNGTLYCDAKTKKCVVNPATVVKCPQLNDSDCLTNICYPAKGVCKLTPRENIVLKEVLKQYQKPNAPPGEIEVKVIGKILKIYPEGQIDVFCDDGNLCTPNDKCAKGTCQASDISTCDCAKDADCAKNEDGNVCNGTMYCNIAIGKCVLNPATVVKCPDAGDNQCAKSTCDKKTGKCGIVPESNFKLCSDGNQCTHSDQCKDGKCKSGTEICPCSSDADCTQDNTLCGGQGYCDKTHKNDKDEIVPTCKLNPATVVNCSSALDTACLKNQCVEKTGKCQMLPVDGEVPCTLGNPCYTNVFCSEGACKGGTNLCACTADADCAYITGDNKCIGQAYCDKKEGACKLNTATVPLCLSSLGDQCNDYKCIPSTGKCGIVPKPTYTPCDDKETCTVSDTCDGAKGGADKGKCQSGTNICQCKTAKDCDVFDDGNLCNGTLYCDGGKCKLNDGKQVVCSPTGKDSCLVNACNPKTGKCATSTNVLKCDDQKPCTADECTGDKCTHTPVTEGVACIDSSTGQGVCNKAGVCVAPPIDGLRFVPGGDVAIGCNKKVETCPNSNEKPAFIGKISGFWMQRFEVTTKAYTACVKAGKCSAAGTSAGCNYNDPKKDGHPINCVTEAQAAKYCESLNPNGTKGRLPTEAEWIKAARGGCELYTPNNCATEGYTYVWGNSPLPDCYRAIHNSSSQGEGCGTAGTAPVGSLLKGDESLYGINDLAGNVAEWVSDSYSATAYADAAKAPNNPTGPKQNATRVIKGGDWKSKAPTVRLSYRGQQDAKTPSINIGFRCVIPQ